MPVSQNFEQEKSWVSASSVGEIGRSDHCLMIQGFCTADKAVTKLTHDVSGESSAVGVAKFPRATEAALS